jgi:hypothetical protein
MNHGFGISTFHPRHPNLRAHRSSAVNMRSVTYPELPIRLMNTFLLRALALLLLALPAQAAPLSGVKSVGPTGDYASLTAPDRDRTPALF